MIYLDIDDVVFLKCQKYALQDALLCPSISAHM